MLRSLTFPVLAACLAAAMALSACVPQRATTGPLRPDPSALPTVPAGGTVKLALLVPLSHGNPGTAALGEALANAARMAIDDAADPLIELAVFDTAGSAAIAAASARRAIDEGADLILGPLFSASTKAVRGVAAQSGVKVISFSTDSSAAGGPVYLSGFLPESAASRVIGFARAKGYDTLGIFYPETPYGQAALAGAQAAAGPDLAVVQGYPRTLSGIPRAALEFADRARAAGVRAVLIAESGEALGVVAEELTARGVDSFSYRYLGLGEWNSRSVLEISLLYGGWFPAPDPDMMQGFAEQYRLRWGAVPPTLAVLGYDAVQIAAQLAATGRATRAADPFDHFALTRPQGFQGAVGPIRFRADGLSDRGQVILQIAPTGIATIDRAPVAFGAGT